jgi:hypothetical protein
MNTPIKNTRSPQPQAQPHPVQPQPAPQADNHPALTSLRRGDVERVRPLWSKPCPNDSLNADGMFFSQLLVPLISEETDHSGFAGSGFSRLPLSESVPTQLIDELAQRLPSQPDGPFSITLLMPNMGKVQVNANKRDNQWNIELGFTRRGVLKRMQPHQRACENALTEALGLDVDLFFHEEQQA